MEMLPVGSGRQHAFERCLMAHAISHIEGFPGILVLVHPLSMFRHGEADGFRLGIRIDRCLKYRGHESVELRIINRGLIARNDRQLAQLMNRLRRIESRREFRWELQRSQVDDTCHAAIPAVLHQAADVPDAGLRGFPVRPVLRQIGIPELLRIAE